MNEIHNKIDILTIDRRKNTKNNKIQRKFHELAKKRNFHGISLNFMEFHANFMKFHESCEL